MPSSSCHLPPVILLSLSHHTDPTLLLWGSHLAHILGPTLRALEAAPTCPGDILLGNASKKKMGVQGGRTGNKVHAFMWGPLVQCPTLHGPQRTTEKRVPSMAGCIPPHHEK